MALAVATSNVAGNGSSTTLVITKPTSLAAGDFLVAQICTFYTGTVTPPSGFTLIPGRDETNVTPSNLRQLLYYKIADSGDASATDFTWTFGDTCVNVGGLARITGDSGGYTIGSSAGDTTVDNDSSPTFTITVTPAYANSLLLYFVCHTTGSNNIQSYAVTTSNPSWTEAYQTGIFSGDLISIALAYAVRLEVTATGDATCSDNQFDATNDWIGAMVVVPSRNITITDTSTLSDTQSYVGVYSETYTETLTATDSQTLNDSAQWVNTDKNSATFLNLDK